MRYLIAREHDYSLVTEVFGNDDEAEEQLGTMSEDTPASLLLFRNGLLMAHAKAGVVFSYRPDTERQEVAA